MSKQLNDTPCVGCRFFVVHTVSSGRSGCMNEHMCHDFSCYREEPVFRSELVALLSEGVNRVHGVYFPTNSLSSWLIKASEALDRE
jgi:hypothetical protein